MPVVRLLLGFLFVLSGCGLAGAQEPPSSLPPQPVPMPNLGTIPENQATDRPVPCLPQWGCTPPATTTTAPPAPIVVLPATL